MKAPRCKLCGKEHWTSEPHVFGGPAPVEVKQKRGLKRRKPLRSSKPRAKR